MPGRQWTTNVSKQPTNFSPSHQPSPGLTAARGTRKDKHSHHVQNRSPPRTGAKPAAPESVPSVSVFRNCFYFWVHYILNKDKSAGLGRSHRPINRGIGLCIASCLKNISWHGLSVNKCQYISRLFLKMTQTVNRKRTQSMGYRQNSCTYSG